VRIEMGDKHKAKHGLLRMLAFALAVLFVVFSAQAMGHSHEKGQNEATCQVCQAAHIGSAPAPVTPSLFIPLSATEYIAPFLVTFHQELFSHDSPSRAPPTA
jgi:Zn-dependent protease with chaperone function